MSVIVNNKKMFKLFWHSDEHTLHPHTPTKHILSNIDKVRDSLNPDSIDLEVWGGDLCHDNTHASDADFIFLQNWVKEYLNDCHKRKTIVRILAGTSSHDWELPQMFELLKPKDSPYVRYVNKLEIEFMDEFNISILYVPDNFGNKPKDEIYEEALRLISSNGLTQVDFIFLHGAFDYQLPPIANKGNNLYDSKAWSLLAKKVILSGHIHIPSTKYNIRCSGSFDRIQFGENHPKGAYEVLFNDSDVIAKFVENEKAMIYDTIDIVPETSVKQLIRLLDKYLNNNRLMNGANIRIKGGAAEVVNSILNEYQEVYPQYNFVTKNATLAGVLIEDVLYEPENFKQVKITKENTKEHFFRFAGELPSDIDKKYLNELLDGYNG